MKALVAFLLMVVLSIVATLFLPWWIIVPICFLAGMTFTDSAWQAFFIGFLSIFLVWGITATISSYHNDFILLKRMGEIFKAPSGFLLLLGTAILGGLVGSLSSLSGYFLQTINDKPKGRY